MWHREPPALKSRKHLIYKIEIGKKYVSYILDSLINNPFTKSHAKLISLSKLDFFNS